jgi:hypothetical protein
MARTPDSIEDFLRRLHEARAGGGDIHKLFANLDVREARAGNSDAARDILEAFADAVDHYSEQSWEELNKGPQYFVQARYLADCFRQILADVEPRKALNLTKPATRPKGSTLLDRDALAAMFWYFVRGVPGKEPITKTKAKELIADQMGVDERTIARAAAEYESYEHPGLIEDEILKVAFKPYADRAGKIIARLPDKKSET